MHMPLSQTGSAILPSPLQSITIVCQYQIILLGDRKMWVNNLPRVIMWHWNDLYIAIPTT